MIRMEVEVVWDEQTERKKKKETSSTCHDDADADADDADADADDADANDDGDDSDKAEKIEEHLVPILVHIWSRNYNPHAWAPICKDPNVNRLNMDSDVIRWIAMYWNGFEDGFICNHGMFSFFLFLWNV